MKRLVDMVLLLLKSFDILSYLIDTNLKSIILCILIVHSQQSLVVLLEVVLPLLVLELILSNFQSVTLTLRFSLFSSDQVSTLNHFTGIFSQNFPCEKSSQQNESSQFRFLQVKSIR